MARARASAYHPGMPSPRTRVTLIFLAMFMVGEGASVVHHAWLSAALIGVAFVLGMIAVARNPKYRQGKPPHA
jgi:hypothetical protein